MNPKLIHEAYNQAAEKARRGALDMIDKIIGSQNYRSIHETSLPPHEAITYLTTIWGFSGPVLDFVDVPNKQLQYKIKSPVNITLMMHIKWETGFKKGYILRVL